MIHPSLLQGMAAVIWVEERCVVPLPAGLDPRDASLAEQMAVLVHSFRRARAHPGMRVAVIGGGTIGLCAVAVARALGCEVALAARHDSQRAAGERLGATEVSGSYDLVIEAAGVVDAFSEGIQLVGKGGTYLVCGLWSATERRRPRRVGRSIPRKRLPRV